MNPRVKTADRKRVFKAQPFQECEEAVIEKIRQRRAAGRKKYRATMDRTDLSQLDWLRHAQQEAMDLSLYLERCIRDHHPTD